MSDSFFASRFDFNRRDLICFLVAAAFHSLLFLWKGGMLALPDTSAELGDMLVEVNFMAEVPNFEQPEGGFASQKKEGFFSKVKSMIQGAKPAASGSELERGEQTKPVEPAKSNWEKLNALKEKAFSPEKGFSGMSKESSLEVAKGEIKEVINKPSMGNFEKAEPNLKENTFKVARKDMPFKIVSAKNSDQLANVNAIPMTVGAATTPSVKSLEGGAGAGPALQSKTLAPKGAAAAKGFGGMSGSGGSSGSDGLLSRGTSAAGIDAPAGMGSAGGMLGTGNGYGSGAGNGTQTGVGAGQGATGKTWGGFGGSGSGTGMAALPRNTVAADDGPAGGKTAVNNSGFNITGALANRPIAQKAFAKYEFNTRVALRFKVDWKGKVLDGILVEISSGNPSFDQKVIAALKEWLFSRLTQDKVNEIQEGVITFVFKGV